jgi:type II secretory pathway pseudopilin PulG
MSPKSNQGFTLVEVLVGTAILFIAFFAAMYTLTMVDHGQRSNEDSLGYASARNKLVSLLIDDTSWSKMIGPPGNADNPDFSCLLNQTSATLSDRDCFGKTAPLVMYNIKGMPYTVDGVQAYDFRSTTQGISSNGQLCNSFVRPPAPGNPQCPYQVVLTWKPICTSAPCVNPPILFQGATTFNGNPDQLSPNVANLNFQVIKSRLYCPPVTAATTPTGHTPAVGIDTSAPTQVFSTVVGNVTTNASGMTNVDIAPCRKVTVNFTEDLPGAFTMDPSDTSSVSIIDANTLARVFEFRRNASGASFDYQLIEKGVVVATNKPSWVTLTGSTNFKFDITDGLVRFCVDDRCVHYFTQKVDFPFRISFQPASSSYTPGGFKDINYSLLDL